MAAARPDQVLISRLAALEQQAQGKGTTKAARAAFEQSFLDQVDPDGVLPLAERQRRAAFAKRAHFVRMQLASLKVRRAKQEAKKPKP